MTQSPVEAHDLSVDSTIYGLDAVFQSCYKFTDRCYMILERGTGAEIIVRITPKNREVSAKDMAGELANELIDQRLRADIARETSEIRRQIVKHAYSQSGF